MNKISAVGFMAMTAVFLSGCNDNVENKTVTKYGTDKCSVDFIAGKPDAIVYVKPGRVEINGWAFDESKHITARDLQIQLTGAKGEPITAKDPVRIDRPDIAKAYNNKELTNSGFNFILDTSSLAPGTYGVTLHIPEGNTLFVCQSKKFVVIM
jgi:YbbR domain-containing protein